MHIKLGPGVARLMRELGEDAITVELTLDFEGDVLKRAVAFPGASDAGLGFQRATAGGLAVWWRQRLLLATGPARVTTAVRPRRVRIDAVGRALSAQAEYV